MATHREEKSELITLLADRRQTLSARKDALGQAVNVKRRVTCSVKENPVPWAIGSIAFGVLATFDLTRRRKKHEYHVTRKGIMAFLLTGAVALAKPSVKKWLIDQVKKQIEKRLQPAPAKRLPPPETPTL